MFVYIRSEPNIYTVGHYNPDGKWFADSDHATVDAATARVMALNGGTPKTASGSVPYDGVNLRDYFAAAALTGLTSMESGLPDQQTYVLTVTKLAYVIADAMLAARNS